MAAVWLNWWVGDRMRYLRVAEDSFIQREGGRAGAALVIDALRHN